LKKIYFRAFLFWSLHLELLLNKHKLVIGPRG
jgi:hypothetical protein